MERIYVFGSYDDTGQAGAAIDRLVAEGFAANSITVLLGENIPSVEFARLKGTHVPLGTEHGEKSDKPLEGSLGILYPGEGPKAGALDDALNGMGVPLTWNHGVSQGKALLSIETNDASKALALLESTGATEIGAPAHH